MRSGVVFGAGSIGRGFIGQLFSEAGLDVIFVDVDENLVEQLNERGEYPLRLVDNRSMRKVSVAPVRAVLATDVDTIAGELSRTEVAATAVGVRVLPHVAPAIAAGLARRNEKNGPLNVILCENHPEADTLLQDAVTTIDPQVATAAGFVRASIGRMVPVVSERNRGNDPLMVWAEPYARLPVDRDGIRGSLPDIPGLEPSSPFSFEIDKKLLLHNMTHAVAAYLGARSGYHCIWEALADAGIRRQVCAAGKSISRALAAEYEKPIRSIQKYARELVTRYRNQALGDTVDRVGRDPERKLGPADRLIGAAKLCAKHGIRMESIASACLAAVEFGSRSGSIATALERGGLEAVLSDVCGLTPEDEVAKAILHAAGEPQ